MGLERDWCWVFDSELVDRAITDEINPLEP